MKKESLLLYISGCCAGNAAGEFAHHETTIGIVLGVIAVVFALISGAI